MFVCRIFKKPRKTALLSHEYSLSRLCKNHNGNTPDSIRTKKKCLNLNGTIAKATTAENHETININLLVLGRSTSSTARSASLVNLERV